MIRKQIPLREGYGRGPPSNTWVRHSIPVTRQSGCECVIAKVQVLARLISTYEGVLARIGQTY